MGANKHSNIVRPKKARHLKPSLLCFSPGDFVIYHDMTGKFNF